MNTYIFILGRNALLSIAEIKAVLNHLKIPYEIVLESYEVLLVDSEVLDPLKMNAILGGTVKIGVVCGVSQIQELNKVLDAKFLTQQVFSQTEKKIQFGISIYSAGDFNLVDKVYSQIDVLCREIKRELSQYGNSVRFAFQKDRFLSSVVVSKNKLIQKGAEVLLIPTIDGVIIGKTLCVQEFEEFSKRDYGRPIRDMKSGVMPPKLARMMINLAEIDVEKVLLDPFCGSGTVLQEAIILGYKNILGRDISQKAVHDTKENIHWLKERIEDDQKIDIQQADVSKLSKNLNRRVDAIVTEPYLGPTLHKEMHRIEFEKIRLELENLYLSAFKEFKNVLQKDGVVIFILPVFLRQKKRVYLDILSRIEKMGFERVLLTTDTRGSITVGNKYDFVLREVVKYRTINT